MSARNEILARIRAGLADIPAGDEVAIPREYLEHEPAATVERFVERVSDYQATVRVTADVRTAVAEACRKHGVERLLVPPGVPPRWLPEGIEAVPDEGLGVDELDEVGAALTGCALAIAETGTIVLDAGERQGRRALTLVPDLHICVVDAVHVVDGVPAAIRSLDARRPITFVSGPSATSDIELSRVEGVHGPRRLEVIVVTS